ncbi:MAG: hypothetical protein CL583_11690 [Alteromonadaceae bacterium]|nr:hypothetical protein [Alteromonadaceae bacterium]|tara:strand:+ start:567 stop:2504 length:1938 start_codon:yes stop_codon:yes gene_type:complete
MKIRTRLIGGFGATLVLAVVVGLIGLNGMDGVNERVGKEAETQELLQAVYEIRQAEKNYVIRRDEAAVTEARALIEKTLDQAAELKANFTDAANRETMTSLAAALSRYQTSFDEFIGETELQKSLELKMRDAAQEVEELATALRASQKVDVDDMLLRNDATSSMISDELEEAEGANRLIRLLLAARTEEKNYMLYDSKPDYDRAVTLIDDASTVARQTESNLDRAEAQAIAQKILERLANYKGDLAAYYAASETQQNQIQDMTEAARATEEQARSALARQAQERNQVISTATMTILATLIAAIALGVLTAAWITRAITGPMKRISTEVARLAKGDLTASFDSSGSDEISVVSRGLDDMVQSLRQLVFDITSASTQLSSAAEEVNAVSRQSSEGVQHQQSEIAQVATSMNEMSSTVQEVSRHAQETDVATREANQQSINGDGQVRKVIAAIDRLAGDVNRVDEVVRQLNTESENIGNVLDVIQSVAEQTNLLALNAAIEAARAGEHGRGFAVVADEVRTLASRTHDSTKEIHAMIEKLQQGAAQTAEAITQSQAAVRETVQEAETAGIAIDQMKTAIRRISDMTTQIASAAEQQGMVAEEISSNLSAIDAVSQESARGSEQTTQASQELATLADQLQTLIGRFKLA